MKKIQNGKDLAALKMAVDLLESDSLTMQLAGLVGKPIEVMLDKLPKDTSGKIQKIVHAALQKSVDAALLTVRSTKAEEASNKTHMGLAAISGAVGGFFGLPGTFLELPVSTTIIMRSVVDIARSQGFDVSDPEVKQECIQVFAMGGPGKDDDAVDSAYYGIRHAMVMAARRVGQAMTEVAGIQAAAAAANTAAATSKEATGLLAKLIEDVATRYGVQVTEKMAAQSVPIVGALSGASINSLFINHFQDMAKGHFIVLRLEKNYGKDVVQEQFVHFKKALQKYKPSKAS